MVQDTGRWTRPWPSDPYFTLNSAEPLKDDRTIHLSCRVCGAGAWALGLDSRLGPPLRFGFHPQPPISKDV